ncbi:hypothetical protein L4C36_13345 [Photobacterium japonica]|uniref:hypothetical protein n=1 Tax=Photobacterium japonica TaxID=2910235 RepID=UPI003D0CF072
MKMDLKLTALAAALLLSGCASDSNSTATVTPTTNQTDTTQEAASLQQHITQAESRMEHAQAQDLMWLASDLMQDAEKALSDAKEYYAVIEQDPTQANSSSGFFSSTTNWQAAKDSLAAFNDAVDQAQTLQQQAHTILAEAFSYRVQLQHLNAAEYFPDTSRALDSEFKTLIEWIAEDDAERATQAQPALVTQLRAFEVKTVTHIYLDAAKQELAKLNSANVVQHAPDTLAAGAAAVVAAEAFITADPRDMATIQTKADEAMFALHHTRYIAEAVQQLKLLPVKDYERYVVSQETLLFNIAQALGAEDSRDRSMPEQGQALVAFITQYQQDLEDIKQLNAKLAAATDKVETLEHDLSQLNEQNRKVAKLEAQLAAMHITPAAPVDAKTDIPESTATTPVTVTAEVAGTGSTEDRQTDAETTEATPVVVTEAMETTEAKKTETETAVTDEVVTDEAVTNETVAEDAVTEAKPAQDAAPAATPVTIPATEANTTDTNTTADATITQ